MLGEGIITPILHMTEAQRGHTASESYLSIHYLNPKTWILSFGFFFPHFVVLLGAVPFRADSERPGKVEEFNKACCPRDREVPSLTAWGWWRGVLVGGEYPPASHTDGLPSFLPPDQATPKL